jgi:hypothetical protein
MSRAFYSKSLQDCRQIITFSLEDSWKLPEIYETSSMKDVQQMMELGVSCFNSIQHVADETAGSLHKGRQEERYIAKLAELERKSAYELDLLKKERATLMTDIEGLRAKCAGMAAAADERAETIRMMSQLESERKVTELKATIDGLRTILSAEETRRVDEVARAVAAKESMITYLIQEKEKKEALVHELQETLLARNKVRANSALKGKEGEEDFEAVATEMGWNLERTSKDSHQCDYKGSVGGMAIFFEIKAHTETIPSKEITKFHRDMKEHPEIGAGVFIALNAPIKKTGNAFWVEWTDDGRLLIFVSELLNGPVAAGNMLHIIGQILNVAAKIWSAKQEADTETTAILEGRLRMGIKYLEGAAERLRVVYNKVVIDRKAAADAYDTTLGMIKMIREEITVTLGTLLGTHEYGLCGDVEETDAAVTVAAAVAAVTQEPPKKKARNTAPKK